MSVVPRECANCSFFVPRNDTGGNCRRHAPRPEDSRGGYSAWPETRDTDFCGEFVVHPDQAPSKAKK